MLEIAVVEDENSIALRLQDFILKFASESGKELKVSIFNNGVDFLEKYRPFDIVFLDIQMPLINGLETAKRLREKDTKAIIIFVTNMSMYAIKGYEVNALDFVVKPVNYEGFKFKLKKGIEVAQKHKKISICINVDRGLRVIDVDTIAYVENIRHRVVYHTKEGPIEEYISLTKAEERLLDRGFVRCNSYYLVNLNYVQEVKGKSVIVEGKELEMSKAKRKEFLGKLTVHLGGGGGK